MFEKHLSFALKYAHESYARTHLAIKAKLQSELSRGDPETIAIWTKAYKDFKRLANGSGSSEEVQTFNMFFNTKSYNTAEESQTKLFSLD